MKKINKVFSKSIFAFTLLAIAFSLSAQGIDEDKTVLYMKANVLMESERYDEAVRMYNRILKEDDQYSQAYVMRAKAKYNLGAYKGTKMDIMKYIEQAGVNKEIIRIMADTEYKLNNLKAAKNYIETAIELDPFDGDLYYLSGMIAVDDGRKNDACEHFAIGSSLDHPKCSSKFNSECYGYMVKSRGGTKPPAAPPAAEPEEVASAVDSIETPDLEEVNDIELPEKPKAPEIEVVKEDKVDLNAVQEHKIDEELSVIITNGLGERNIEELPNIFILSSEDGVVAIDLCIDSEGKVFDAQINREKSTIYRSSLTSLAIRKAKEFIFMPSLSAEQCGTLIYKISAQ